MIHVAVEGSSVPFMSVYRVETWQKVNDETSVDLKYGNQEEKKAHFPLQKYSLGECAARRTSTTSERHYELDRI